MNVHPVVQTVLTPKRNSLMTVEDKLLGAAFEEVGEGPEYMYTARMLKLEMAFMHRRVRQQVDIRWV